VLHGTLQSVAGGIGTVIGEGGRHFALTLPPGAALTGQEVAFTVRRDHVRLTRAADAGASAINAVTGLVRAIEYQGTFVKATLLADPPLSGLGNGNEFVVYIEEGQYFRVPIGIGERAVGAWDISDTLILKQE
jgi:hypothetical protein